MDKQIFTFAPTAHIPSAKLLDRYRSVSLKGGKSQTRKILLIARSTFASDLPTLSSIDAEVEAIVSLSKCHRFDLLKDREAVKGSVISHLESADVIHVATHTLANSHEARSAIVLSDGVDGDEMLWASEITQLKLRAQVVFLSACSSAVGSISVGEGLMSVARSFLLAGCQSVIASLWPVVDSEVPPFVRLFYKELFNGSPASEALQLAKQKAVTVGLPNRIIASFQIYGGVKRPMDVGSAAQLLISNLEA